MHLRYVIANLYYIEVICFQYNWTDKQHFNRSCQTYLSIIYYTNKYMRLVIYSFSYTNLKLLKRATTHTLLLEAIQITV